jgi:hypothetical protein
MARWLGCAVAMVLLGIAGCGGEPAGSADEVGARRFTLTGVIGATQGVVLQTGTIVDVTWGDIGQSDIYMTLKMSMMLHGLVGDAFCHKGQAFATVADIPSTADDCEWKSLSVSGNIPGVTRGSLEADGYLFQDVNGDRLHRLLIVQHSIDALGTGSVTFDILAVD